MQQFWLSPGYRTVSLSGYVPMGVSVSKPALFALSPHILQHFPLGLDDEEEKFLIKKKGSLQSISIIIDHLNDLLLDKDQVKKKGFNK